MALSRVIAAVPTLLLGGLSAVHLAWANGSTYPFKNRKELALKTTGQKQAPSPQGTAAVGGALAVGAALAAGAGSGNGLGRFLRRGLTLVFAARAVTGYRGTTLDSLGWKGNAEFVERDRRFFAPLCAVIAGGLLLSDPAWRRRRG